MQNSFKMKISAAIKLVLFIFLPLTICTCKDEEKEIRVNEIVIGSETYQPKYTFVFDLGPDNSETHYGYYFYISDGEIEYDRDSEELSLDNNATFILSFLAGSLGIEGFDGGTFDIYPKTYVPNSSSYFIYGFFDALDDFTPKEINGGTIIINENENGIEFDFDLNVQGRELTGFYAGRIDEIVAL